jgi:hypothetical protein
MIGFSTFPPPIIGYIFRIGTRKPDHLAIALESQNMRSNPIEKPAVVRNN